MKIDLVSIDLDAFADWDVFVVTIALLIAFGIFMAVSGNLFRPSPVERLARRRRPDPYATPIGDMPNVPAERSLTEAGQGFTIHQLNQVTRSARRAAPAGQGSGGDGNASRGAAAAGPQSWRGNRAH